MDSQVVIYVLIGILAIKVLFPSSVWKRKVSEQEKDDTPKRNIVKEFVELWPDTLTIPAILLVIALFVWMLTEYIIPITGQENVRLYTWEDAQGIMYGLGAFFIASFFAFYWIRLNFKGVFKHYSDGKFSLDFEQLTPFNRWLVLLSLLGLVFYVLTNLLQV